MPPLPKSSRRPSTGKRERDTSPPSSSEASSASSRSRTTSGRTTKIDILRDQVARMYMMLGVMVRPFGRFYPVLEPVGENFQSLADDAAQAWIDLAEKDPRVMQMLVSLTGASVWGNVIGIHIAIFASALPGGTYISQMAKPPADTGDPVKDSYYEQGRAMGLTDEEIEVAMSTAMGNEVPVREQSSGGPGDTVRTGGASAGGLATAAPPVSKSAIVTPDQLGVTQVGDDGSMFPTDASPPNGTGSIS